MPCDEVRWVKTVYKVEHHDKLKTAAEALGYTVTGTPDRVVLTKPGAGQIVVEPGQAQVVSGSDQQVGDVMKGYAEQVFNSMIEGYPDRYIEQPVEGEERVFTIVAPGSDPYGNGGY